MNLLRLALRAILGKRLPTTQGTLRIPGINAPIMIHRDQHGVPLINATNDADAWFAVGFCHAQDRPSQLEVLLRIARGTLAEMAGNDALPVDQLSRRVGFRHAAQLQLEQVSAEGRVLIESYTAGVNAGFQHGFAKRPHEFVVLGINPTPWAAVDVLAYLKLQPWFMASNWDSELARLRILLADGPEALLALDPSMHDVSGEIVPNLGTPSPGAVSMVDRFAQDIAAVQAIFPRPGGSNNWVIAPEKSATGRPIVANDPHLNGAVPAPWYLATVRTPAWAITGATFVGSPSFPCGHNGHSAWGVTAGLADNADLFVEQVRQEKGQWLYRQGDEWLPCDVRQETIRIKKAPDVVETCLATPRGPIISGVFHDTPETLSLRAIWLSPTPVNGWLGATKVKSFREFRDAFRDWPGFPMNLVYADVTGTTGWQFVGELPIRGRGHGLLPKPGCEADTDWKTERVPFEEMPFVENPTQGFVATANNRPRQENRGTFLGADWLDSYRHDVISEDIRAKEKLSLADCEAIQLSVRSIPWRETRDIILAIPATADNSTALTILTQWDGHMKADSPAATIFELFMAELCCHLAKHKAPKSWEWALGGRVAVLNPYNFFGYRRFAHAIQLLKTQPAGWFSSGWPATVAQIFNDMLKKYQGELGPDLYQWRWGTARPLVMAHSLMGRTPLRRIYNLPAIPGCGDEHTPNHASAMPLDPLGEVKSLPNLRAVIDVGNWAASRWQLAGGQSGNPFSPHYADLFANWKQGKGVFVPFTNDEIQQHKKETLELVVV